MKILRKLLNLLLLAAWFAPATALLFDWCAWLLTAHMPIGDYFQIDTLTRITGTIFYSLVMIYVVGFIAELTSNPTQSKGATP